MSNQLSEQLLQDRIDSLQRLLKERKTRLVSARRRTKISSALVNSADYTIQQSKRELQRARDARCGNLSTTTTAGVKSDEKDQKQQKSQSVRISRCEECNRWLKERDKFWGLESESEEEDIKEFNKHVRRRSLQRVSRPFEATGGISSASSKHGDVRRVAGRGTWTTPAYELEKGWFGPKQGRNRYLFSCFRLGKKCSKEISRGILSYFGHVQNYLWIERNLKKQSSKIEKTNKDIVINHKETRMAKVKKVDTDYKRRNWKI